MARTTTVDALRKRGIAKVDAEILADAGFTLDSLASAKPESLQRFLTKGYVGRSWEIGRAHV